MAAKKIAKKAATSAESTPKKTPAKKTVAKKSASKTVVKPEKKPAPSLEAIARGAYLNYRRRVENGLPGDSHGDWLQSERQLREADEAV